MSYRLDRLLPVRLRLAERLNSCESSYGFHQGDVVTRDWIDIAAGGLLDRHESGAGWGYRNDGASFVEPTAVAMLALASRPSDASATAVEQAAAWLAGLQHSDGHLGLSADIADPGWTTPWAVLAWAVADGFEQPRQKATQWILRSEGKTIPPEENLVVGHDSTIPGWPWVHGAHGWVEPTATALWALRREGLDHHARFHEGVTLLADRAISAGAWNYGNSAVFGSDLRPQPAPTGMALVALAGCDVDSDVVERACAYLRRSLPRVRAPRSLAWGLLGLTAWQQRPPRAEQWLEEAFGQLPAARATALDWAPLVLAGSPHTLELLAAEPVGWS